MFCPKCGAEVENNAAFCGNCGYSFSASEPETAPAVAVKNKKEFVKKVAPQKVKTAWMIATVTFIICTLILLLGLNSSLNGQFYNIPIFGLVIDEDMKDDLKDSQEDAEDYLDDIDDLIDEDDLSSKEKKLVKKVQKSYKKLVKTISINNVRAACKDIEKAEDILNATDDWDEIVEIMDVLVVVIYIFFLFPIVFTVLGGLKKSVGLIVTGTIFAMIFLFIFGGVVWALLALVAYIVQIKYAAEVTKAYKAYRATGATV